MSQFDAVVVGSYNQDLSFFVSRLPAPGETILSEGRLASPGGKGSNQAIQAARCGARTVMVAAVGDDPGGEAALALWRLERIATDRVARVADAGTGAAVILVDAAGENQIVVDSGANNRLSAAHVDAAAAEIGSARVVLAQLETPMSATARAFEIARGAGAATLLNAAPAPAAMDAALLALTDILIVNEGEGRALSGLEAADQIGEALMAAVGRAVVVTLGSRGAMLFERGRPPRLAASPSVDVVDTTGAGDAFVGAFAARLAATGDAAAALLWGVTAGALACTAKGAAASCARAEQIAALAGGLGGPV